MAPLLTGLNFRFFPNCNMPFPQIGKSEILGCFSVDTNRKYKNTAECLRYFRKPQEFPLDLNIGYGLEKSKYDGTPEKHLDDVFEFINHYQEELLHKSDTPSSRAVGEFDFICFREVLIMVMCTPYTKRDDWYIRATNFKGNIYLTRKETTQKQRENPYENEDQKKAWSFGHKFEQYCLTKNPCEEPNTSVPVDQCEKFCCMYRINIEGMELLFGAKVDGAISNTVCQNIQSKGVLNSLNMVELKCALRPSKKYQVKDFCRYKYKNWWCQNFLIGIEDLMVGFRNESGLVEEIQHMKVSSLPGLSSSLWSPSQCADFLVKFLHMVKVLMKDVNCPHTVYEFRFNLRSKNIEYEIYPGKSSHSILPDWYVSLLQQCSGIGSTKAESSKSM